VRGRWCGGVNLHTVSIPAGTIAARFSLFDERSDRRHLGPERPRPGGDQGFDRGRQRRRHRQRVGTTAESSRWRYKVCVVGYAPRGGSASYVLSSWLVNSASTGGNFKVNVPSSATIGGTASVGMSWSGLATGKRYVGAVNFLLGGVKQGTTVIDVDTTDPCRCSRTRSKKTALAF
jgi:hypothetical protein